MIADLEAMREHDRQGPPDSLHATVSASNATSIVDWRADLRSCADLVRGRTTGDSGTSYATIE